MVDQDPKAGSRARAPLPPSLPEGERREDLSRLGEALKARVDEVLEVTLTQTAELNDDVDPVVRDSFERISRNAMAEALEDLAAELGVAPEALPEAMNLLQLSLEFNLLRMCECFEAERRRTDEELNRREEELAFLATHDSLTGLPNRTLILDRTEQMLARSRRNQTPSAALFLDLDNFKDINDTLGHSAGDELLQAVAARLGGVVRETDALGRLGGDEFVVISEELSPAAGPELVAERLLDALEHPFKLGEGKKTQVVITAGIGIAMTDEGSADELLRNADIAMYRAKWEGRNRFAVFATDMQERVRNRVELEMDLREALDGDQFFLVYQPTIDLTHMRPTGMEALIRWTHPERGLLQPESFIPLLEETGLITEVGRWVLEQACRQAASWHAAGHPIGMAVNVSGRQLDTDQITDDVEAALSGSGLDPAALTIEVTETSLMRNVEDTARRLTAIKGLGVRIAIDDFGTGYSSLAHLQRFPVDALKIDRSFIAGLKSNSEGETLIHSLVQLGKALSIETFAEGIEGPDELSLLRKEECDSGQGFLFARPLEAVDTEDFLRGWADGTGPALRR